VASSHQTVLFVPGFMQHADSWLTVARTVSDSREVTILDFETWTWEERLAELREAATAGSVLVGYSMGGRLVLHAALADPGRYSALVLLGAHPGIEDAGARTARREADEQLATWIEGQSMDAVVDRWEGQPVFASQSRVLRDLQREGRLDHDPALLARLLRSGGQGAVEPVWDRLGELTMPVLVLAGALDEPYVVAGARLAAALPNGKAATVMGAGHAAHLEEPAATAAAILSFRMP
jgi:2-succinyl-6-hydroxy-2,4-cyclohexadiene-1-carboxylate synthase